MKQTLFLTILMKLFFIAGFNRYTQATVLSCYTGSGNQNNITQCSSPKNAYCVILTISNSINKSVTLSCIDNSCTAFNMMIGDTKYESKCCDYDNCNFYLNTPTTTPSKPLSCWVGGSFMGESIPSIRTLCSEYDNQYCNLYIGYDFSNFTSYYYQSCASSCTPTNVTFESTIFINKCCQSDYCNVYPQSDPYQTTTKFLLNSASSNYFIRTSFYLVLAFFLFTLNK